MSAPGVPRLVLVWRRTEYEALLAEHGTHEQARFFLAGRGQDVDAIASVHQRFQAILAEVERAIPRKWRRARVLREDLHRFLFEPQDVVVVLGQDGLVANVAKYLQGQPVVGLNPDPARYDGILVPHPPEAAGDLIESAGRGTLACEERSMVEARLDDGQRLRCLNEVFVGHVTHQSARYVLVCSGRSELQSSSGVLVATGTGATGWAASIRRERATAIDLPEPTDRTLVFFVREAFPSVATGTSLTEGTLAESQALAVESRMNRGGRIFGDGIEDDFLRFDWGRRVEVGLAAERLRLVRA